MDMARIGGKGIMNKEEVERVELNRRLRKHHINNCPECQVVVSDTLKEVGEKIMNRHNSAGETQCKCEMCKIAEVLLKGEMDM